MLVSSMALPFALFCTIIGNLGVPQQALGGVFLGLGIVVEDKPFMHIYIVLQNKLESTFEVYRQQKGRVGGGRWGISTLVEFYY